MQSYWLALQFWVQPNRIFTVGVPQASHGMKLKTCVKNWSFWFMGQDRIGNFGA